MNVEQSDLGRVKTGLPAEVPVDSFDSRGFAGVVEIINPSANKNARFLKQRLKSGMGKGFSSRVCSPACGL